jgi:hypothetical protein
LTIYFVFVAVAPGVVWALRRAPALALVASAALWLAVELAPQQVSVPNLASSSGTSGWNPFSWQLLFCLGLWVGEHYYHADSGRAFRPVPWVTAVCWAVIAANFLGRALHHVIGGGGAFGGGLDVVGLLDTLYRQNTAEHETLERLTHFLAVAYIVAGWLRPNTPALRSVWCEPLIRCGRHSLEVFCLGVLLSELGSVYLRALHPGFGHQLLLNIAGWAALCTLALFLDSVRRPRSSSSSPPTALATAAPMSLAAASPQSGASAGGLVRTR